VKVSTVAPALTDAASDVPRDVVLATVEGLRSEQIVRDDGSVVVTAVALEGYAVQPGSITSWDVHGGRSGRAARPMARRAPHAAADAAAPAAVVAAALGSDPGCNAR